jgi:hypothetical protein
MQYVRLGENCRCLGYELPLLVYRMRVSSVEVPFPEKAVLFLFPVGPTQSVVRWVLRVKLTTFLHLVPRLRMLTDTFSCRRLRCVPNTVLLNCTVHNSIQANEALWLKQIQLLFQVKQSTDRRTFLVSFALMSRTKSHSCL